MVTFIRSGSGHPVGLGHATLQGGEDVPVILTDLRPFVRDIGRLSVDLCPGWAGL